MTILFVKFTPKLLDTSFEEVILIKSLDFREGDELFKR
jgi:hypothetical protein